MSGLQLLDVEKTHPGGRRLFKGLNLEIEEGKFTSLVGPSGCGKSSLLRLIAGLDQPSRGQIRHALTPLSFVFQEPRLLPWRNVEENLRLPFEIQAKAVSAEEIRRALAQVRLTPEVATLFPHQLSGGMKMRAALARALLTSPRLLMMDEPLAALDESTRQILQEEIANLHESNPRTSLFVTHSLSEALFLSDRVLILGPSGELRRDFRVELTRPRKASLRSEAHFIENLKNLSQEFRQLLATEGAPA